VILRTSWLYGLRGRNFMRTVLRLARERDELSIVDDQIGCPTWCRMVAEAATAMLVRLSARRAFELPSALAGVYHLCATGRASWFEFAAAILERAPAPRACRVRPIPTREFPRPAARPAFSVLDCGRFEQSFGIRLPHWRDQLALALDAAPSGEPVLESSGGSAGSAARHEP
jgi:dTDP-4-dehydrorhamnose reductase